MHIKLLIGSWSWGFKSALHIYFGPLCAFFYNILTFISTETERKKLNAARIILHSVLSANIAERKALRIPFRSKDPNLICSSLPHSFSDLLGSSPLPSSPPFSCIISEARSLCGNVWQVITNQAPLSSALNQYHGLFNKSWIL
jgi:hypothetical protein